MCHVDAAPMGPLASDEAVAKHVESDHGASFLHWRDFHPGRRFQLLHQSATGRDAVRLPDSGYPVMVVAKLSPGFAWLTIIGVLVIPLLLRLCSQSVFGRCG